eukprot:GHVL01014820.1.p1 GENE.GHVL01014820.1~~GHVL01014820.1.p1  ORF type:complete len:269 (-),score=28.47 GHVL01014820.1:75-881(-)
MEHCVSEAEFRFITDGVAQNFRNDGRSHLDYREINIEKNVIPSAAGSCRVRVGDCDVLSVVKCELGTPLKPDEGTFNILVDCVNHLKSDNKGFDASNLTLFMQQWQGLAFDRKLLSLETGTFCWHVYVDCLVMSSGGNMRDVISIAVRGALENTIIPSVKVSFDSEETSNSFSRIQVDDRLSAGIPFPTQSVPILISVVLVGDDHIWDPTHREEEVAEHKMTFVILNQPCVGCVGVCTNNLPHSSNVKTLMQVASEIGGQIIQQIKEK